MNRIEEIQREIESVRSELNESFLQNDEFEEYYRKSTELDKLIEEYQAAIQNKDFLIDKLDNTERELWVFSF